ncbi:hypothetical protein [Streptomyces sp. DH10]|uniref:hypothetical protein n=1 Tax=Streptomyces sp. DH10 TaxID=3040121 RepID=UPI00244261D3|nr:hypothetical protein [Streptomyces sp. DH10]MDG9711948.1 hypothetical protein [Streptomyces sp. DH10]
MTVTGCHWLIPEEPLPVPLPTTGVRFRPASDTTAGAPDPPANSRISARTVSPACP